MKILTAYDVEEMISAVGLRRKFLKILQHWQKEEKIKSEFVTVMKIEKNV